jgi:hypothetical protein
MFVKMAIGFVSHDFSALALPSWAKMNGFGSSVLLAFAVC